MFCVCWVCHFTKWQIHLFTPKVEYDGSVNIHVGDRCYVSLLLSECKGGNADSEKQTPKNIGNWERGVGRLAFNVVAASAFKHIPDGRLSQCWNFQFDIFHSHREPERASLKNQIRDVFKLEMCFTVFST